MRGIAVLRGRMRCCLQVTLFLVVLLILFICTWALHSPSIGLK